MNVADAVSVCSMVSHLQLCACIRNNTANAVCATPALLMPMLNLSKPAPRQVLPPTTAETTKAATRSVTGASAVAVLPCAVQMAAASVGAAEK